MKKYILISLLFHLSFFLIFNSVQQLGNEELTRVVPITFVSSKTSPNPGSQVVAPKEAERKEEKKVEKKIEKKEERKIEKKEIKSKVADKSKEPKKEERKETENKESKNNNSEDKAENLVESSGSKDGEAGVFQGSNFMADGDGGYIALSSAGINYTILNEVEPEYPSQAEAIGYSNKVVVSVRFLVGLKGEISKIEITKSHSKLGFDDEVKKAIKKWRFKPIYHHGKNIKVYFEKDFIFNPK